MKVHHCLAALGTLLQTGIDVENPPFVDCFPTKKKPYETMGFQGFATSMLVCPRVTTILSDHP